MHKFVWTLFKHPIRFLVDFYIELPKDAGCIIATASTFHSDSFHPSLAINDILRTTPRDFWHPRDGSEASDHGWLQVELCRTFWVSRVTVKTGYTCCEDFYQAVQVCVFI